MKSLVTCDQVGGSLEMWLKTASAEQLQDFYTQLLKHIKNCDGTSLEPSDKLATCKNVEDALKEHGKNLNQGENLPADASDCNRPVTICGLNNMLNATEDNAVKQAMANASKNKALKDKDFRLALGRALLSKTAGNRIEARDDGIGVWDTAPPDLRYQYVDAINGDDNNSGSKGSPLRTVAKAISRIAQSSGVGDFDIRLKAGQRHVVQESLEYVKSAAIMFNTYDEPKYGDLKGYLGYYPMFADDYSRATLEFVKYYTEVEGVQRSRFPVLYSEEVSFFGLIVKTEDGVATFLGDPAQWPLGSGSCIFLGCDIHIGGGDGRTRLGSVETVRLKGCNVYFGDNAKLVKPLNAAVFISLDEYYGGVVKTFNSKPQYTHRNVNTPKVLTKTTLGLTFPAGGQYPLGGSTNFVVSD